METGSSALEMAIAALLVVMGLRFLAPRRALDWAAFAVYAAAVAAIWAAAQGRLSPTAFEPPAPVRIAGGALLVGGLLLAGAATAAHRRGLRGEPARAGLAARVPRPVHVGLGLVVAGHALRAPGAWAGASAAVAIAVLAVAGLREARSPARPAA